MIKASDEVFFLFIMFENNGDFFVPIYKKYIFFIKRNPKPIFNCVEGGGRQ